MRGMKLDDLIALLDFLYYGNTNIYRENLNSFLNIAEELQLQGLNGGEGWEEGEHVKSHTKQADEPTVPSNGTQSESYISETSKALENHTKALYIIQKHYRTWHHFLNPILRTKSLLWVRCFSQA